MKAKVLIFEDERSIADTLIYALETEGYQPVHALTGADGLRLLEDGDFKLVILDVGLPDMNGFEVCKRIRASSSVPVFFLTARNSEIDKIVGLEIGADDYITKPFSPREVTARVKAMFRRLDAHAALHAEKAVQGNGPFQVDPDKFRISLNGKILQLTRYEFGLLQILLKAPGRVYSRAQLMDLVWDTPDMSLERTIDTHIKSLRTKMREFDGRDFIVTHRGIGYSFSDSLAQGT